MSHVSQPSESRPSHAEPLDPLYSDPVLEAYRKDLDVTLIERSLRLSVAERARQLALAAQFLRQMRPLVQQAKRGA